MYALGVRNASGPPFLQPAQTGPGHWPTTGNGRYDEQGLQGMYGKLSRGALRMLISAIAAFVLLATSTFAEHIETKKDIKLGAGCLGALTIFAPRLGTCEIVGSKARIWCPNGEIFDRGGQPPNSSITRSICNLSQVLE
jgi:hypothetical protein